MRSDDSGSGAAPPPSAAVEIELLGQELAIAAEKERTLRDTRRAVVNLLEDLDDDRARLARAEQEWRAAFDGIRDAMFLHDGESRILRANRAYLALAGCGSEEPVGRPYFEVFPKRDGPFEACPREGAESEFSVGDQLLRSRCYLVKGEAAGFAFTVRVLEDITERRRSEQELHRRTEQLAVANRALEHSLAELRTAEGALVRSERLATMGTLASGVAHELNNPLMGLLNYVDFAQRRMTDPKGQEVLAKANRELHRMEGVVHNLLRLGRSTSETLVRVAVSEPLARALELLAADLRKRQVEVFDELPELPLVWANGAALQQVFLNLLINAADAMNTTGEKRIRLTGALEGDVVRVTLSDTGIGVAPEHQSRLFEPFYTSKPEGQGTGLGLSISRRIMTGFGGALDYLPQPPPGATFMLTLRVASDAE